jgi:Holliday junction DNA helicase RuvA
MIGKLSGIIDSFGTDHLILNVGGVGYLVNASSRTLSSIGTTGDPAALLINTQVREDAITLYGFADATEQEWFKLLTSVQGVGAKAGLAILTVCMPEQIAFIIASQDKTALTRADGVGPKLATRILTELKDKAGKISVLAPMQDGSQKVNAPAHDPLQNTGIEQDAVSALTNLGYARTDAYTAVMAAKTKANDNEQSNLENLIRLALKELSA